MRLLNTHSVTLTEFVEDSNLPQYAILSHTWGTEEVTFQDMQKTLGSSIDSPILTKQGYKKVQMACKQALGQALSYIWIDTCCIDKTSSSELSEAINSMFRWYSNAKVCYTYLVDAERPFTGLNNPVGKAAYFSTRTNGGVGNVLVEKGDTELDIINAYQRDFDDLKTCRWFTRGWTLQELIAPRQVLFFSQDWVLFGSKKTLREEITAITGIDGSILDESVHINTSNPTRSSRHWLFQGVSIAKRFSWAAKRNTTRIEDMAYCLLGIFDVNMPLLYGERDKAFIRLQEEIMKTSSDQSVFAWGPIYQLPTTPVVHWHQQMEDEQPKRLLATSPANFTHSGNIIPFRNPENEGFSYESTKYGLRISLIRVELRSGSFGLLSCYIAGNFEYMLAIRYRYEDGERTDSGLSIVGDACSRIGPLYTIPRSSVLKLGTISTLLFRHGDVNEQQVEHFLHDFDEYRFLCLLIPESEIYKTIKVSGNCRWNRHNNIVYSPRAEAINKGNHAVSIVQPEVAGSWMAEIEMVIHKPFKLRENSVKVFAPARVLIFLEFKDNYHSQPASCQVNCTIRIVGTSKSEGKTNSGATHQIKADLWGLRCALEAGVATESVMGQKMFVLHIAEPKQVAFQGAGIFRSDRMGKWLRER